MPQTDSQLRLSIDLPVKLVQESGRVGEVARRRTTRSRGHLDADREEGRVAISSVNYAAGARRRVMLWLDRRAEAAVRRVDVAAAIHAARTAKLWSKINTGKVAGVDQERPHAPGRPRGDRVGEGRRALGVGVSAVERMPTVPPDLRRHSTRTRKRRRSSRRCAARIVMRSSSACRRRRSRRRARGASPSSSAMLGAAARRCYERRQAETDARQRSRRQLRKTARRMQQHEGCYVRPSRSRSTCLRRPSYVAITVALAGALAGDRPVVRIDADDVRVRREPRLQLRVDSDRSVRLRHHDARGVA